MRPSRLSHRAALGAEAHRSGADEEDGGTGFGRFGASEDELGTITSLDDSMTSEDEDSGSEEDDSIIGSEDEDNGSLGISLTSEHAQKYAAETTAKNADIK